MITLKRQFSEEKKHQNANLYLKGVRWRLPKSVPRFVSPRCSSKPRPPKGRNDLRGFAAADPGVG